MGRTVVFVGAHPDDDTFGIARSIALRADDPGLRLVLVLATDGEAGTIAPGVDATPETLGALRRKEDMASWEAVGRVPDRIEWFGLPDGGLADHDFDDLVERIYRVLVEESPDVVGTFGPDGITGHPDHVTVGAATDEAFRRCVEAARPGFRRLLHGCLAQSDIDRWNANLVAAGEEPWDPEKPFHLRGVPDETIGVRVDTRDVVDVMVAAIRAHRSQWSPEAMPTTDDDLMRSLRTEDWVIAWPPTAPGTRPLGDIFDDLQPDTGDYRQAPLTASPAEE